MSTNSVRSIVVVDDSVHDYETYVRYLKKSPRKFNTKYMNLGKELLASTSERPDCVLLDLSLPDTSGLEILRRLKAEHEDVLPFPIVMVTGSGDDQTGEQAVKLGAQDYLVKEDVTPNSLLRSIEFAITRFRLEQQLRESEARYRALAQNFRINEERLRLFIENAPAGIAMFDREMCYLAVSRRFLQDFGVTGDVIGRSHYEIFPEIPDHWKQVHRRVFNGEVLTSDEDWFLRADGRQQWVKWEVRPWNDARGIGGMLLFEEEITERVRAENRLRESERRLSLVVESADLGTWDWDIRGDQLVWSEKCLQLFGLSASTPMSYARFLEAVYPDDREAIAEAVNAALRQKAGYKVEMRIIRPDGSMRWIAARGRATYDALENPTRMSGVVFDITNAKLVEEALRKSEEHSRQLAEKMNQAATAAELSFWSWDVASGKLEPDKNNRVLLGLPVEGPVTFADFIARIHPDDREALRRDIERCLKTGVGYDSEFRALTNDSSVRWISARGSAALGADGQAVSMSGIAMDITRRKELVEALRESEERLRLALDAAGMGSWAWDLQGDQISWSKNLESLMAMPPGSFHGGYQRFLQLVHPEDRDKVDAAVQRSIRHGDDYRVEFRMQKANGEMRWTETRGMIRRDDNGTPIRFYGVDLDITERKHAEETLELALDAAQAGEWSSHPRTGEFTASERALKLHGFPAGTQLNHQNALAVVHPEDRGRVQAALQRSIDTGAPYSIEARRILPDGSTRWFASDAVVRGAADNPQLVGLVQDIHERKMAEEKVREAEQRIRIALRAARSGTWEWNLRTGQALWSPEVEALYGLPPGSFSGDLHQWRLMVHPGDLERIEELADEVVKNKLEYHAEFRIRRADGEPRWVEAFATVFYNADGEPERMIGVNIDITERKKTEEELQQARANLEIRVEDRTKELAGAFQQLEAEVEVRKATEETLRQLSTRLLRTQDEERRRIARDLHDNTGQTLAALKMELARVQSQIDRDHAGLLDDSKTLTDQVITDIRTMSHLLHPPLLDDVGFNSAARWYVEGFEKRSGITVSLNLQDVRLSRDAALALFRILQESLTNVLRHSGAKAAEVRVSASGEEATLVVRDFGKGISKDRVAEFNRTGTGVGVGLAGMRERLSYLKGNLEVRSEEIGTSVIARLPAMQNESQNVKTNFWNA